MKENIIFIDKPNSFITMSIMDVMKNDGYDCKMTTALSVNVEQYADWADGLFLHVSEEVSKNSAAYTWLTKLCAEKSLKVYIFGYEPDVEVFSDAQPGLEINHFFKRPINAKEILGWFTEQAGANAKNQNKKHILVVDDSGPMLHTIKNWLEPKYQVSIVNSATNAISFLGLKTPDLILLDYEMPVCSGGQMLEMIRTNEETKDIPVIFLTGRDDAQTVQSVIGLNPQGYLLKTLPSEQITKIVDEFFAKN